MNNQTNDEYRDIARDIEKGYKLERLSNSDEFTDLISDGFIKETLLETSRDLLSDDEQTVKECIDKMKAVNILRKHLESVKYASESALTYEEEE